MDLYIDLLDPKDGFFISASFGKDNFSFDGTFKGKRVIKQIFVEKAETTEPVTWSWDRLHVIDCEIKAVEHIEWVDKGNIDIENGEVYKTIWEKPISEETYAKLFAFSSTIYKSERTQQELAGLLKELDTYVSDLVQHL